MKNLTNCQNSSQQFFFLLTYQLIAAALFTTYKISISSGVQKAFRSVMPSMESQTAEASSHDATHVRICCFSAQLDRRSMTPQYRDLSAGGELGLERSTASLTTPHLDPQLDSWHNWRANVQRLPEIRVAD